MYYGWWDAAANQNVRFDEQYADYETQPGNIGDMSKLNPDWHPTINNKARPMDLQVRKTSVSDRDEGLVGATYALYMVNELSLIHIYQYTLPNSFSMSAVTNAADAPTTDRDKGQWGINYYICLLYTSRCV